MEGVAALLAFALQTTGVTAGQLMFEPLNYDVRPVLVTFAGQQVDFQHQLWRIKEKSVCQAVRMQGTQYAACTQAAQRLFQATCEELTARPPAHPLTSSVRQMYCTAAVSYQPAQLEWAPTDTADSAAGECRAAQAALLVDKSPEARAAWRRACGAP